MAKVRCTRSLKWLVNYMHCDTLVMLKESYKKYWESVAARSILVVLRVYDSYLCREFRTTLPLCETLTQFQD